MNSETAVAYIVVGIIVALVYEPVDKTGRLDLSRVVAAVLLWPLVVAAFLIRGALRLLTDVMEISDE